MANETGTKFSCPSCGASVMQDPNRNSMYCSFCGQPIIDVRSIIEQQEALDIRKQEMEAVRGHKAEMQEMDIAFERKMANAQAKNKFVSSFGGCFGTVLGRLLGAVFKAVFHLK